MQLSEDEARAIDEAARVLCRVVAELGHYYEAALFVRVDWRCEIRLDGRNAESIMVRADLNPNGDDPSPGAALRRLVGR